MDVPTGTNSVEFTFKGLNAYGKPASATLDKMYIWAVDANGNVSSALKIAPKAGTTGTVTASATYPNAYQIVNAGNGATFTLSFAKAGQYKIFAGVDTSAATGTANLNNLQRIGGNSAYNTITVTGTTTDPNQTYAATVEAVNNTTLGYSVVQNATQVSATQANAGVELGTLTIKPNNVATNNITVTFEEKDLSDNTFMPLYGKNVAIEVGSGNITVNKTSATTNVLGQIQFQVAAGREGKYKFI